MNKNSVFFFSCETPSIYRKSNKDSIKEVFVSEFSLKEVLWFCGVLEMRNITKKIDNVKINELSNTAYDKQEDIDVVGDKRRQIIA